MNESEPGKGDKRKKTNSSNEDHHELNTKVKFSAKKGVKCTPSRTRLTLSLKLHPRTKLGPYVVPSGHKSLPNFNHVSFESAPLQLYFGPGIKYPEHIHYPWLQANEIAAYDNVAGYKFVGSFESNCYAIAMPCVDQSVRWCRKLERTFAANGKATEAMSLQGMTSTQMIGKNSSSV